MVSKLGKEQWGTFFLKPESGLRLHSSLLNKTYIDIIWLACPCPKRILLSFALWCIFLPGQVTQPPVSKQGHNFCTFLQLLAR